MAVAFVILALCVSMTVAVPHHKGNTASNKLIPKEWFPVSELENTPSFEDVTLQTLEKMSAEKGAYLIRKYYHLAQLKQNLSPSFVPSPSNIPVTIYKPDGNKVNTKLNQLVEEAKQLPEFGQEEVTVFLTGFPEATDTIEKATRSLIQAYILRYSGSKPAAYKTIDEDESRKRTSSEEDYSESWKKEQNSRSYLVVIDLGASINNMKRFALLDIEQTGAMIAKVLTQLTKEANVPYEVIHILAQNIAAHVAGAAGRQYTRLTGQQLRRITALDPSKIMAFDPARLTGLARGDAEFVDAIHTSANGLGTRQRVGDIDFFPNGPADTMPGANNVVEASMRATRYYAESVRPGSERNFPAVPANSLEDYTQKNGYGKRAFMGIDTEFDARGDYVLEVNANSPFGKRAPAEKQNYYHGTHSYQKNW